MADANQKRENDVLSKDSPNNSLLSSISLDIQHKSTEIRETRNNRIHETFKNLESSLKVSNNADKNLSKSFFQSAKILALALATKDPYTGDHSDRVFQISKEIGGRFNLSADELMCLEGGALLHDIGKIGIKDAILLKPGSLTDVEYKEMQLHPIIGAQIINKISVLLGCVDVVLYHHERIDGYGYPYGLKGSEIPLIARIASVTDAYDAMTTNRVYRRALSHEQALEEIIRNRNTQFDADVVKVFVQWWEETFQKFPERGVELYRNSLTSYFD